MIRTLVISGIIAVDHTGRTHRLRKYASAPPRPTAAATHTINPLLFDVVV